MSFNNFFLPLIFVFLRILYFNFLLKLIDYSGLIKSSDCLYHAKTQYFFFFLFIKMLANVTNLNYFNEIKEFSRYIICFREKG